MKFSSVVAVLSVILGVSSPILSFADPVTKPVTHSGPGFDADAGICWAFALTGLMEGEALKKGQNVSLSAEYLGFYNLYSQITKDLPAYKELATLSKDLSHSLADRYVKRMFDPTAGGTEAIGLNELAQFGIVPETFFQFTFYAVPDGSPTLADRLLTFAETRLIDPNTNAEYMSNPYALMGDLGEVYGKAVPKPTDTFTYEGKEYTALTFLSSYLAFTPGDYQEVNVAQSSLLDSLQLIQKVLEDNIAVPIGFLIIGDQLTIEKTGEFTIQNCANGDCANPIGGHEVLAVSSLVNTDGMIDALIVKSDWGQIGLNDQGNPSTDRTQLGYFQLTRDYLQEAMASVPLSITVPKRYLSQ